MQVSPGVYRPEDIPLIRLFNPSETPSGNSTQNFSGVPAGGIMGGGSLTKNYTPFRLDAIGSAGSIALLTENSSSSLITRTIGGHDYTWRLIYFGNIDHSGNVSRNFGSFNNNDIVLLGVSTTATPNLVGDYNRDNVVDAADFVVWRMSNGQPVANPGDGADGNNSGAVDDLDYTEWQNHYGSSQSGSSASHAVPEPATYCIMLFVAISALATPNRPRRA